MRPKFNKLVQRWGICSDFADGYMWMTRGTQLQERIPLKFQSKQEAARFIVTLKAGNA